MRQYKAIIIDGKKLLRRLCLTAGLFGGGLLCVSILRTPIVDGLKNIKLQPEHVVESVLPAAGVSVRNNSVSDRISGQAKKMFQFLFRFSPDIPDTIFAAEIPLTKEVYESGLGRMIRHSPSVPPTTTTAPLPSAAPEPTPAPAPLNIPPEHQAPIQCINASPTKNGRNPVVLGNETSYSVDIDAMLSSNPSIDMHQNGPKVLVIHTHATEAYAPEGSTIYDTTASDRSENTAENVVKAGTVLCDILNQKGIETIHDKTLHDVPSFNGSYAHSLNSMEYYLQQYPSIQIIFDIHRDSIVYSDQTKAKPITEINGKNAAQLMFVVGTDQKGLHHPDWRENIKNAIHFQNAISQRYPTLMRHINLRRERFNGHTSNASMIIETGSSGNSLSEAIYGLSLAAECIGDYLNSLK